MARRLSSLWLQGLRQLGKIQQSQSKKLLKSLLPKPAKAARSVKPNKALSSVTKPSTRATKSGGPPSARLLPAASRRASKDQGTSGTWKQYYFSPDGLTATRRMRRMAYWLYLPRSPSTASDVEAAKPLPLPLVVMLHGCKQTAADFAISTRMNALAERKGFAVLYPQQSASVDAHRCWHWFQRRTQQGLGETSVLVQLMAQVQTRHGLDATRTYVAGLSAGAALAALVGLRHPEAVAAIGLHSAPVFGTAESAMAAYHVMQHGAGSAAVDAAGAALDAVPLLTAQAGLPVILVHGQHDTVVRRVNLAQLSEQFEIVNAASTTRAEPVHRSYAARTSGRSPRRAWTTRTLYAGRKPQVVSCEINGLGHAWSGGDDSVPFTAREGPDAALMMWQFFARHRRLPKEPEAITEKPKKVKK